MDRLGWRSGNWRRRHCVSYRCCLHGHNYRHWRRKCSDRDRCRNWLRNGGGRGCRWCRRLGADTLENIQYSITENRPYENEFRCKRFRRKPYLAFTFFTLGFMYCMILARRVRSISSSSSITAAFLFNVLGGVGAETRIIWLAIRVR